MGYFEALYKFALQFENLEEIDYTKKNLVFLGASAMVAVLMILLDFAAYYLKGKSLLEMHYNKNSKFLLIIIIWTFASVVVSYLGIIMHIFNSTIQSCVIVGGTWIYSAAKIANQKEESKEKDIQQ